MGRRRRRRRRHAGGRRHPRTSRPRPSVPHRALPGESLKGRKLNCRKVNWAPTQVQLGGANNGDLARVEFGMPKSRENLLQDGYFRSSINRPYYAAYAALSGNLDATTRETRFDLAKAIGRLWKARVNADYVPAAYVDQNIALDALRDANAILLALEISNE